MSTDRTTELLNYVSAISREIGAFRAETKQQFADVNTRLDTLEMRMTNLKGHVGSLETEMRASFEKVHRDVRIMHRKFEVFPEDMMELRVRQRDLEKRTEVLEKKAGITDSV